MAQQEEAFSGWVDTTQFTYWRLPIYRFQAQKWWGNGNLKSGEGSLQDANQGCNPTLSRLLPARHCYCLQPYTKKQWAKYPAQLDAEVFTRLPYREDNDDRYNVTNLLQSTLLLSQILWWPLAAPAQGWLHLHVWEHTAEGPQDHCQAGHGLLQVRRGNDVLHGN